jgi:hypothetical protein
LREGQRDHQEIGLVGAQGKEAEERAHHDCQSEPGRKIDPDCVMGHAEREECDRVGRGAEVRGVPQRGEAGVSEKEVEAHGEDGEDDHLGEKSELV